MLHQVQPKKSPWHFFQKERQIQATSHIAFEKELTFGIEHGTLLHRNINYYFICTTQVPKQAYAWVPQDS